MILNLPDSFLIANKRALSSYLLAIRESTLAFHRHDEEAANQIASAQLPTNFPSAKLAQKAVTSRKANPARHMISTSTTFAVPNVITVDDTLFFTTDADAFSRTVIISCKLEKVANATSFRFVRMSFKVGGVNRTWDAIAAANDRGITHIESFSIGSGAILIEVEYDPNGTLGTTLEGERRLDALIFRNAAL